MTPVYSPIGSAPACPRSYAAEVASLETPLRVGTSCHLQLLHVLAIGVPRKRRSSSGFLKTRRTRLPRSGLVQTGECGVGIYVASDSVDAFRRHEPGFERHITSRL